MPTWGFFSVVASGGLGFLHSTPPKRSRPLRAYPQKPPSSLSSYTSLVAAIRNLPRFKEREQRPHLSMEGCHRFLKPCFQITTQVLLALFKDGANGASRRSDSAQVPEWNGLGLSDRVPPLPHLSYPPCSSHVEGGFGITVLMT